MMNRTVRNTVCDVNVRTFSNGGSGTPVSGYMPRGYNCGFIYDGGSPRTIAHELGHGIAGLEHPFENSNASGKTANLMDYATGEQLWHFQWDQIQDPGRVWMKWNKDEEEGEILKINIINNDDLKKFYLIVGELKHTSFFKIIYNILEKLTLIMMFAISKLPFKI